MLSFALQSTKKIEKNWKIEHKYVHGIFWMIFPWTAWVPGERIKELWIIFDYECTSQFGATIITF